MKRHWTLRTVAEGLSGGQGVGVAALIFPAVIFGAPMSSAVAAEPPECPPGEWFCDEAPAPEAPLDEEDAAVDNDGGSEWTDERAPAAARERSSSRRQGRAEIDVRRSSREARAFDADERQMRRRAWSSPWGVNLRVEGVMLGERRRRGGGAGMGGIGVSLRYEVNPTVTLDLGFDSILGTDYNGYDRGEVTLSFSSLLYLNQHRLIRTYGILGLNSSAARVDIAGDDQSFSYFGAHAGLGLAIALDRGVALNLDLLGFVRGRTDSRAAREPEFVDGSGRVSNTSGGGVFRGGITLDW